MNQGGGKFVTPLARVKNSPKFHWSHPIIRQSSNRRGRNIAALNKTQNKKEPTMNLRICFVTLSYILSKIHSVKSLRNRKRFFSIFDVRLRSDF